MNAEHKSRLIDIDWQPSAKKLRQFAACLALFILACAWYAAGSLWMWALVLIAVIAIIGWQWPGVLKPLYIALTLITLPIGMVVGELALLAIYLFVFVPIGLIFRVLQRDALQRKLDRSQKSYWQACSPKPSKSSYLRRY